MQDSVVVNEYYITGFLVQSQSISGGQLQSYSQSLALSFIEFLRLASEATVLGRDETEGLRVEREEDLALADLEQWTEFIGLSRPVETRVDQHDYCNGWRELCKEDEIHIQAGRPDWGGKEAQDIWGRRGNLPQDGHRGGEICIASFFGQCSHVEGYDIRDVVRVPYQSIARMDAMTEVRLHRAPGRRVRDVRCMSHRVS